MEIAKREVLVVEEAVKHAVEGQVRELSESQLALVGGGIGNTIL
jgi:hypothetical protein